MSFTTTATPLSDSAIHGIREQILSNAAILYPHEVWNSASWQTYNIVKPQQIFTVVVSGTEQLRATILVGSPNVRIVATGPLSSNAHNALCGLLTVTCEALSWYTENLVGELQNKEECGKGHVDYTMVIDGYNFASERRIIENLVDATCGSQ